MRRERRPLIGGFPGTLGEARWRVSESLRRELAQRALSPLEQGELVDAVTVAYGRARREWLEAERGPGMLRRKSRTERG